MRFYGLCDAADAASNIPVGFPNFLEDDAMRRDFSIWTFCTVLMVQGVLFNNVYGGWMSEAYRRVLGGEVRLLLNGRTFEGGEVFYGESPLVFSAKEEGDWLYGYAEAEGAMPEEWLEGGDGPVFEFPGDVTPFPEALQPGMYFVKRMTGNRECVVRIVKRELMEGSGEEIAFSGMPFEEEEVVLAVNLNDSDNNSIRDLFQDELAVDDPDLRRLRIRSPYNNHLYMDESDGDLERLREEGAVLRLRRSAGVVLYGSRRKGQSNRVLYGDRFMPFDAKEGGNGFYEHRFGKDALEEDRAFVDGLYMEGVAAGGAERADLVEACFLDVAGRVMTVFKTPLTCIRIRMNYTPNLMDMSGGKVDFFTVDTPLNRIVNPAVIPIERWDEMEDAEMEGRCAVLELVCEGAQVVKDSPELIEWRVEEATESTRGEIDIWKGSRGGRIKVLGIAPGFVTIGIGPRGFEVPYIRYRAYVDTIKKVRCGYQVFSSRNDLGEYPGMEERMPEFADYLRISNIFLRQAGVETELIRDMGALVRLHGDLPEVSLKWRWWFPINVMEMVGDPSPLIYIPRKQRLYPPEHVNLFDAGGNIVMQDLGIFGMGGLPFSSRRGIMFNRMFLGTGWDVRAKLAFPVDIPCETGMLAAGVLVYHGVPEWVVYSGPQATPLVGYHRGAVNINIVARSGMEARYPNIATTFLLPANRYLNEDVALFFEGYDEGEILQRPQMILSNDTFYQNAVNFGGIFVSYKSLTSEERGTPGDHFWGSTLAHEIMHTLGVGHRAATAYRGRASNQEQHADFIRLRGFLPVVDVRFEDSLSMSEWNNAKNLMDPIENPLATDLDLLQAMVARGSSLLE